MNPWRHLTLRPLDTLFFRDNRPFNQDDEGLGEARSMFPPMPFVLAGAVRASIARAAGWDGGGPGWAVVRDLLGDGPLDPGRLRFGPPVVLRHGEPLYPCPAALLVRPVRSGDGEVVLEARLARPVDARVGCDLALDAGRRLAGLEGRADEVAGFRQRPDLWLTASGMARLLAGGVPTAGERVPIGDLLQPQPRIGLERDYARHTARTGMLYQAFHQRPRAGIALGVAYRWEEAGETKALPAPQPILALGGHGRAVSCDASDAAPRDPTPGPEDFHKADGHLHYMVVLLSPALLGGETGGRRRLCDLPGEIVSACVDRPLVFGGWDAAGGDRLPSLRYHRAGSAFFMRADAREVGDAAGLRRALAAARARGLGREDTTRVGCGAFLFGVWRPGRG